MQMVYIMNKLPQPLVTSQNIETNRLPPSTYRQRFQSFDLINYSNMWGNIQLNLISLHLLNKLGNNNLSVMDIKSVNEILEIKNLNNEIIKQIERLGDQISKDFIKLNN